MEKIITQEAIRDLNKEKAPGPEGISNEFY